MTYVYGVFFAKYKLKIRLQNQCFLIGLWLYGATLADTVAMITESTARLMGTKNKGKIRPGFDADMVISDNELKIRKAPLEGRLASDNDEREIHSAINEHKRFAAI